TRAWNGHKKDTPVISMVHEPDFFDELRSAKPLDLQLSGHTHGGQCRLPLVNYTPAKVKFGRNYIYGHFEKNASQLFVGRGIGTVGIRVRFACRPELVILTLRST
ncbi:metallophosphoesterase, partial [bacterium]|nr:metallophosphoesterase [bacterium]